jgi:anaphase-promoting complex subunit 2
MKNHPRIQSLLDQFSTEYAKYKNPRRLVWFHQLGQVQVELNVTEEGADGELLISTKEFTCTPLQATLISHFEDNDGYWTATDLSNETSVSEDTIKKKMNFWINNNVIKAFRHPEGGVAYQLRSYQDSHSIIEGQNSSDMYDDDDEGFAVSLSVQEEEEIKAYESYIVAMLSNLGQLPLERIHNMLKMFVTGTEHRYNRTPQQLSMFLQQLCKEEKLEYGADGMYKLLKK